MDWARPPPMPLIDMRFGQVQSNRRSAAHVVMPTHANRRRTAEGFQGTPFQLASASQESAATLNIQETVRRFLQQVYIPSGQFLDAETDLPENVQTIMNYYGNYFETRSNYQIWSEKYTGAVKMAELARLPVKTGWDQAYKYYRWNFTNPQQCAPPPSVAAAIEFNSVLPIPKFDFGLNMLGVEQIRTYAQEPEAFQASVINTGTPRVKMTNQKFQNGVLMIRFDEAVQFDGYSWNRTNAKLINPPLDGWVLQGSNDETVWSGGIDAQAFRDNLQLDSPKWTTLHIVGTGLNIPELVGSAPPPAPSTSTSTSTHNPTITIQCPKQNLQKRIQDDAHTAYPSGNTIHGRGIY